MGTRGAYGFLIDGTEKVTYKQFDSYPCELGAYMLGFVKNNPWDNMREIARRIILIDESKKPTKAQIKACEKYTDLSVSEQSVNDWYCLLRKAQGDLDAYKDGLVYMIDSRDFLADSLFCEYAYIINCDTGFLEFYRGYNTDGAAYNGGRYCNDDKVKEFRALKQKKQPDYAYYGVKYIRDYSFDRITRTEDLAEIGRDMESLEDT